MEERADRSHWIFANKPAGEYDGNIWDMGTILETGRYSLKEREPNRARVRPGDMVYMRVYGRNFIGRFCVGSEWTPASASEQKWSVTVGTFEMHDCEVWSRPLPQGLVLRDLSSQNLRRRIVCITHEDGTIIETAQRVYARLGFGGADGQIVVLEKGLEEAIKPNLPSLGLKLADKRIRQQFRMGVGIGRSDLICTDEAGDLVVLELKRAMGSDEVVGQVLRYVGWVRENIAEDGQRVRGCIVAGDYDEGLRLAASAAGVKLLVVRLP